MAVQRGDLISSLDAPSFATIRTDATTWNNNQCASNYVNRSHNGGQNAHNYTVRSHNGSNNTHDSAQWSSNLGGQRSHNASDWSWNYAVYNTQWSSELNGYNARAYSKGSR